MKFSGFEIRTIRMAKQMKQLTLAKKMNITKQRFSQIENSDCLSDKRANEILAILGFSKDDAKEFLKLCR